MAGNEITVGGKTFKTKKEAAEYYNLNEEMVYGRLRRGIPIEEAFELIPRKRKYGVQREITVGGKTFETIADACKYYNLKESKVRDRINQLDWSIEEAFELVPRRKNKKKRR